MSNMFGGRPPGLEGNSSGGRGRAPPLNRRKPQDQLEEEVASTFKYGNPKAPQNEARPNHNRDMLGGGKGNAQSRQGQDNTEAQPRLNIPKGPLQPPSRPPPNLFGNMTGGQGAAPFFSQSQSNHMNKEPNNFDRGGHAHVLEAQPAREDIHMHARGPIKKATGPSPLQQRPMRFESSDPASSPRTDAHQTSQQARGGQSYAQARQNGQGVRTASEATAQSVKRKEVSVIEIEDEEAPSKKRMLSSFSHREGLRGHMQPSEPERVQDREQEHIHRREAERVLYREPEHVQYRGADQMYHQGQESIQRQEQESVQYETSEQVDDAVSEGEGIMRDESPQLVELVQRESTPTKGDFSIGEEICKLVARTSLQSASEDQVHLRDMLDAFFAWFGRSTVQKAKIDEQARTIEELLKLKEKADEDIESIKEKNMELKSLMKEKFIEADKVLHMWTSHKANYKESIGKYNVLTTQTLAELKPILNFVKGDLNPDALLSKVMYMRSQLDELKMADIDVKAAQEAAAESGERAHQLELLSIEQKTQLEGVEGRLKDKDEYSSKLQQDLDAALKQVETTAAESKRLQEELSNVKVKFTGETSALEERLKAEEKRIDDKDILLAESREEVSKLKHTNNTLRLGYNKIVEEKKDLERSKVERETALQLEWQSKVTELEQDIEDRKEAFGEKVHELEGVKGELTEKNEQLADLHQKSKDALSIEQNKIHDFEKKIVALDELVKEKDALLEEKEGLLAEKEEACEAQASELQTLSKQVKSQKKEFEKVEAKLEEKLTECDQLKKEKKEQIAKYKNEIEELTATISVKDTHLAGIVAEKKVSDDNAMNLGAAVTKLKEELKEKTDLLKKAAEEVVDAKRKINGLREDLKKYQREAAQSHEFVESTNADLNTLRKECSKVKGELEKMTERLQGLAARYAEDALDAQEKTIVDAIVARVQSAHESELRKKDETIERLTAEIARREEASQQDFAKELDVQVREEAEEGEDDDSIVLSKKKAGRTGGNKKPAASKSSTTSTRSATSARGKNKKDPKKYCDSDDDVELNKEAEDPKEKNTSE